MIYNNNFGAHPIRFNFYLSKRRIFFVWVCSTTQTHWIAIVECIGCDGWNLQRFFKGLFFLFLFFFFKRFDIIEWNWVYLYGFFFLFFSLKFSAYRCITRAMWFKSIFGRIKRVYALFSSSLDMKTTLDYNFLHFCTGMCDSVSI